jgi:SAM-dependent methyltransferase
VVDLTKINQILTNLNSTQENIANQFDLDYEDANGSLYNARLGKKRVIAREVSLIINVVSAIIYQLTSDNKYPEKINILDFGCGNGRLFEIIQIIAKVPGLDKIEFNYTGYDISKIGLSQFVSDLTVQNFISNPQQQSVPKEINAANVMARLRQKNLTATIIHAAEEDINQIKPSIGNDYHLIMCMYGVLSCVPGRSNRSGILRILKDALGHNGKMLLSVPSKRMFYKEQCLFERLREKFKYEPTRYGTLIGMAKENGDIYYTVNNSNKSIKHYCHIFSMEELITDILGVSMVPVYRGIYSFSDLNALAHRSFRDQLDHIFARSLSNHFFSSFLYDKFASYLVVMAEKSKFNLFSQKE